MPHLWHVEPPLRGLQASFDSAMRHKSGSKIGLSHPETSCDGEHNILGCLVTFKINDCDYQSILAGYFELLIIEVVAGVVENSASNAGREWRDAISRSSRSVHAPMQHRQERSRSCKIG